ncbi:hypothetical protein ACHAXR_001038, partial [Thalassiosira sp. AJA248-18]
YVVFLLSGYTIEVARKKTLDDAKCKVGTIKAYLRVVNKHYRENGCPELWNPKDESDASILLKAQESFEKEPARRSPLHPYVLAKMCELSKEDPLGFKACVWDFTGLGRFGGFRQQEFAMDSKKSIKQYVLPDGSTVVRCFTTGDFIMYDKYNVRIKDPLRKRAMIMFLGTHFGVQKNRMNGQIVNHARLPAYPEYCPVNLGCSILTRAQLLGYDKPDDPLCVYRDDDGDTVFLTGVDVTAYYRLITKLVLPNISDEELSLISTHSIRVTACVLLHEAGKDGPYIKLRLRWLSNCFEIYLRNTNTITMQHGVALESAHQRMVDMIMDETDLTDVEDIIFVDGSLDMTMDDLEDED